MFELGHSNYLKKPKSLQNNSQYTPPLKDTIEEVNKNPLFNCLPLDYSQQDNTKNDGKWSLREIMRYYNFLLEFKQMFKSKEQRRSQRIFALMSKHIRTRKTIQCKSHHQKIQKNYRNIEQIIAYFEAILSPLKEEWKEFIRTEKRVLINAFPELNKSQNFYQIMQFKNSIRIYINDGSIRTYDQQNNN